MNDNLKMMAMNQDALKMPIDAIVVDSAEEEASYGELFRIQRYENDCPHLIGCACPQCQPKKYRKENG